MLSDLVKTLSKAAPPHTSSSSPCSGQIKDSVLALGPHRAKKKQKKNQPRQLAWETACLVIPFDGSGKALFTNTGREGERMGGGGGETETERNLMKHRLASRGPTGRLWPSFTTLLLLFLLFVMEE